ncbi:MAG TPA: exodeoxyribonuclease III, partial [Bryobacteraceae bacterium]|nr:exodeoxyribonuclease III [Bryobacteraceae bacterium]
MKVASWNVNSIRKRLPILLDWLEHQKPDVLCLQETKVQDKDFPELAIKAAGYHTTFRGITGFNGVATLTLAEPERIVHGLHGGPDIEDDRILLTVVNGVTIVNTYVPQGYKINSEKYAFKLEWFRRVREYFDIQIKDASRPAIWLGDINVAPEPIDVYHPDRRVNDVDFHIDARNAFRETLAWGFVDIFRKLHPERVQYTYWDYFRNALANNWGWRIDHILAT